MRRCVRRLFQKILNFRIKTKRVKGIWENQVRENMRVRFMGIITFFFQLTRFTNSTAKTCNVQVPVVF